MYFCGHSLGAQPFGAREALIRHLDKWASEGVEGHFTGDDSAWATLEDSAASASCGIVGAEMGEVVYMNSLTVNLHLLMTAFYRPDLESGRVQILIEDHAFPSDEYAVQSHLRARGVDSDTAIVRVAPRANETLLNDDDLLDEIRARARRGTLALVLLPGVQYCTGQVLDMKEIARLCNELSVPVGFDLAHAVGNIPLQLHDWGVDFAVWCSYKYLNSGPGSLGGAFVHSRHGDCVNMNRLGGWWGHERESRFAMGPKFVPQTGVYGFQVSNPSVFGLAPVIASLKMFEEAGGMQKLRKKSVQLTGFLEAALMSRLVDDVDIISPRDPSRRGCQLSIRLRGVQSSAGVVQNHLKQKGVICDVREPGVLRIAPTPLYNSFRDVEVFVSALSSVLASVQRLKIETFDNPIPENT